MSSCHSLTKQTTFPCSCRYLIIIISDTNSSEWWWNTRFIRSFLFIHSFLLFIGSLSHTKKKI